MPAKLVGIVRFPSVYAPWYVYTATLVTSPAAFEYLDILIPGSDGKFDRLEADDAVLTTGYAFALEPFETGMTSVQVAVPGSAVPFVADNSLRPTSLVKTHFASTIQNVTIATATDLAAGKVLGRFRNHHEMHSDLRVTSTDDVVVILTGVC